MVGDGGATGNKIPMARCRSWVKQQWRHRTVQYRGGRPVVQDTTEVAKYTAVAARTQVEFRYQTRGWVNGCFESAMGQKQSAILSLWPGYWFAIAAIWRRWDEWFWHRSILQLPWVSPDAFWYGKVQGSPKAASPSHPWSTLAWFRIIIRSCGQFRSCGQVGIYD